MVLRCLVHGLRKIPRVLNREGDHLRREPHRMGLILHFHRTLGLAHHQLLKTRRVLHRKQHHQTCLRRRVQHPIAQVDSPFPYKFLNIQEVQSA